MYIHVTTKNKFYVNLKIAYEKMFDIPYCDIWQAFLIYQRIQFTKLTISKLHVIEKACKKDEECCMYFAHKNTASLSYNKPTCYTRRLTSKFYSDGYIVCTKRKKIDKLYIPTDI